MLQNLQDTWMKLCNSTCKKLNYITVFIFCNMFKFLNILNDIV